MKYKAESENPPEKEDEQKIILTDHYDPKKKTWCSYMEKGFRESRSLDNKEDLNQ